NASTRRIAFDTQFAIGGAGVEAQAAMDTLRVVLVLRLVGSRKAGEAADDFLHRPPTNVPGFRMPLGSSVCFTFDIKAKLGPGWPQRSVSVGEYSTTTDSAFPASAFRNESISAAVL